MVDRRIDWKPPGPVARAFYRCWDPAVGIMGPVGSGKTSTSIMKMVRAAARQKPSLKDGWRRVKFLVVRDTYRQLWDTTIRSYQEWMPIGADGSTWLGGKGAPATHTMVLRHPKDGGPIELVVEFVAIGENRVEDVLRGYECTGFYLNEADLIAEEVFNYATTRTGRFPKMDDGGPTWHGIVLDLNAPDVDNWVYRKAIEEEVIRLFVQPSGFDENAENLANLVPGYYERVARGQEDWFVRRVVRNQFGYSRDGQPVYPEFNEHWHVADRELEPVPGIKLQIGGDAGRTPAAIVGQMMPSGQLRILDEIIAENMGARSFGKLVRKTLLERYPAWLETGNVRLPSWAAAPELPIVGWGDPAAQYRGDLDDEETWLSVMSAVTGFRWRPAPVPGNSLTMRLEAVRHGLNANIDGAPGLLISKRCKVVTKGFASDYRYKRLRVANAVRFEDVPEKNAASHPADGVQYLALGATDYAVVMGRAERNRQAAASRPARAIEEEGDDGYAYG